MWFDPSHAAEQGMVRGIMTQHVMEAVSKEMFGGAAGRQMVGDALKGVDALDMPADRKNALRTLLQSVQLLSTGRRRRVPSAGSRCPTPSPPKR